jgi:tRNA(fMet)-specific endonuclease VapC
LDYFAQVNVLDFDLQAAAEYARLRGKYRRLGRNDLRIAAITLVIGAILVTRNMRDFSQIESLQLEDWT